MNLNKTMKNFGLAGTGVIALLLIVIVYYLHLIEENTSLEAFSVGGQDGATAEETPYEAATRRGNERAVRMRLEREERERAAAALAAAPQNAAPADEVDPAAAAAAAEEAGRQKMAAAQQRMNARAVAARDPNAPKGDPRGSHSAASLAAMQEIQDMKNLKMQTRAGGH
jgi:hypothetical protein